MSEASAPGKLILCGEHAVVYGQPAIALPLLTIRARAHVAPSASGSGVWIHTPDLDHSWAVIDEPDDPISEVALAMLRHLDIPHADLAITLTSDIPIASGMGSGAAIATALVRALAAHFGHNLTPGEVSALVYTSEQRYHGTPSGIDNTVVAYEQAIWFERRLPKQGHPVAVSEQSSASQPLTAQTQAPGIQPIAVAAPFTLIIGDTGIRSATRLPVGEVRRRWQTNPAHYDALFNQIGTLVLQIKRALVAGDSTMLGPLLNINQALLAEMGVSSPELEYLITAARSAGALGAKLSGAGWGGIMIALTDTDTHEHVSMALRRAGATRVLGTTISTTARR